MIDTIDTVCTNGSMAIGQISLLWSIDDSIDQKKKNYLTDGSITSMKMRLNVSIDTIGIDPSLIVPIYGH